MKERTRQLKQRKESRRKQQRRKKRQEAAMLATQSRNHLLCTTGKILAAEGEANRRCIEWYGFVSDYYSPEWRNRLNALSNMSVATYLAQPNKLAFHDLCSFLTPPPGCLMTLGLGLKFIIERPRPPSNFLCCMDRF